MVKMMRALAAFPGRALVLIRRVGHDWFTCTNNEHFELGRALWFMVVVAAIVYPGIAMWYKNQPFNVQEFCIGLAAILAAGGFGVAQKDNAKANATTPPPGEE